MSQFVSKDIEFKHLEQKGSDTALVFFGFKGCSNVCPVTLSEFATMLEGWPSKDSQPHVLFVDIDANSSDEEASYYAKQFHSAIKGVHVNSEQLALYSFDFGLQIKQSDTQISHIGKTYLLRRFEEQWKIVRAYQPSNFSHDSLHRYLTTHNNDI
ncbi:SCO family protein [Alteromonas gracilis]|uniref:SCO family protein n=1 Tax=Alteromonas gracilis TaxID=1479524 RepID=UPI003735C2F0